MGVNANALFCALRLRNPRPKLSMESPSRRARLFYVQQEYGKQGSWTRYNIAKPSLFLESSKVAVYGNQETTMFQKRSDFQKVSKLENRPAGRRSEVGPPRPVGPAGRSGPAALRPSERPLWRTSLTPSLQSIYSCLPLIDISVRPRFWGVW